MMSPVVLTQMPSSLYLLDDAVCIELTLNSLVEGRNNCNLLIHGRSNIFYLKIGYEIKCYTFYTGCIVNVYIITVDLNIERDNIQLRF